MPSSVVQKRFIRGAEYGSDPPKNVQRQYLSEAGGDDFGANGEQK